MRNFKILVVCLLLLGWVIVENIVTQTFIMEVYGTVTYYPSDGDAWTENDNSTVTWYTSPLYKDSLTFQTSDKKVGGYALLVNHTSATAYIAVQLDLNSLKNVSGNDTLGMWLKFVSPVASPQIGFCVGETSAWSGARFKWGPYPILNDTWQQWFLALNGWAKYSGSPTWSQIRYLGFTIWGLGSADKSLLYIDGLRFQTFETPIVINSENDLFIPNSYAFFPRFADKKQVYNNSAYTGLWDFYYLQGGTGGLDLKIEAEALGQTILALSIAYNITKDAAVLDKAKLYAEWLLKFQHSTYKAFNTNFNNFTKVFQGSSSTVTLNGWVLAGLSYIYSLTLNSTYKTAADDLRGWFCDKMWDNTNKWYDSQMNLETGEITNSTSWAPMPQGSSVAGLASYYRFVSTNATVKTQLDASLNKALTTTTGANFLPYGGGFEDASYVSWGFFEAWKAFNNATYRSSARYDTDRRLNNYLISNNGSQLWAHYYGRDNNLKLDGWGVAFSQLLQLMLYEDGDTRSLATYRKTMFDYIDAIKFSSFWAITRFRNGGGVYQNITYTPNQAFLYASLVKYYYEYYKPTTPYAILSTAEATAQSYTSRKFALTTSTVAALEGLNITAKVYIPEFDPFIGDDWNVFCSESQGNWGYRFDVSSRILSFWAISDGSVTFLAGYDVVPPMVWKVDYSPPPYNSSVTIKANITDSKTGVRNVTLSYLGAIEWINVTMVPEGEFYVAEIPAFRYGTVVRFVLFVADNSGNWRISEIFSYDVIDKTPPEIGVPEWYPLNPSVGEAVLVRVSVSEPEIASGVGFVRLYYSLDTPTLTFTFVIMTLENGAWSAVVPPVNASRKVTFYVQAMDMAGNVGKTQNYSYTVLGTTAPSFFLLMVIAGVALGFAAIGTLAYLVKFRKIKILKR